MSKESLKKEIKIWKKVFIEGVFYPLTVILWVTFIIEAVKYFNLFSYC